MTRALQIRLFSLRGILGVSLLLLALVPAVLVAWLMAGASARAVQDMAGGLVTHVAVRGQLGTEDQLPQAHGVLNGLLSPRLSPTETPQARGGLPNPASSQAPRWL